MYVFTFQSSFDKKKIEILFENIAIINLVKKEQEYLIRKDLLF